MQKFKQRCAQLFFTLLCTLWTNLYAQEIKPVDVYKTSYEKLVNMLKNNIYLSVTDVYDVVSLTKGLEIACNAKPDISDDYRHLLKKSLMLRANMAAKMGNFDDLVTSASLLRYNFPGDSTYIRYNEFIDRLMPKFTDRISGYWVCSHNDEYRAPMMAMCIDINNENDKHEAMFLPNCNIFNCPEFKDCIYYITNTKGVEYTPSKSRLKITFMAGNPKGGNTEMAKSISEAGEKFSSRTTEDIAIANRNNPLSASNIAQQTVTEGIGRIAQGIAREMAVSKITSSRLEIELYELCPGVLKADLDYHRFVNRSDGDSYIDEFVRRSFFLYKVSVWDQSDFISPYGQFGLDAAGVQKLGDLAEGEKMSANLNSYNPIKARTDYWRSTRRYSLDYTTYSGNWRGAAWYEIDNDLKYTPNLHYPDFVKIPFPGFKESRYKGSFEYKTRPDFFYSPMFLMEILEDFDNNKETIAGIHYKYQQPYDSDHKKYLKMLKNIVEPRNGVLDYWDNKKKGDYNYEGGFSDYKFNGKGVIKCGRYDWDGSTIEEGTYKNGKLQK